ncbi:hypothetical protein TVNIR_1480 [Thioalkalivibrio nitratireducens DSM 14787]|uniref:Uncharacterized protein n=1 Tax=Thioalkalivibrio nitratireducens (strain DSM 14787 / UNIQEM 213 / ALEN2) TaxID=1255043 RepID=L0DVZ4_THIND|nr:hypothetical protein TVNIR_1480 [Thioalkalivibrio nitratireducens DSM 14787]
MGILMLGFRFLRRAAIGQPSPDDVGFPYADGDPTTGPSGGWIRVAARPVSGAPRPAPGSEA